jgi:hypothetical protein
VYKGAWRVYYEVVSSQIEFVCGKEPEVSLKVVLEEVQQVGVLEGVVGVKFKMSELDVFERFKVLTFTEAKDKSTITSATALTATAYSSVRDGTAIVFQFTGDNGITWKQQIISGGKECLTDDRVPVQEPVKKAFESFKRI